jgi:hypothetical protein
LVKRLSSSSLDMDRSCAVVYAISPSPYQVC